MMRSATMCPPSQSSSNPSSSLNESQNSVDRLAARLQSVVTVVNNECVNRFSFFFHFHYLKIYFQKGPDTKKAIEKEASASPKKDTPPAPKPQPKPEPVFKVSNEFYFLFC